jgi:hypothetical protein
MAKNVCRLLLNASEVEKSGLNLGNMPLGDLFRTTSLTSEEYELLGIKFIEIKILI